MKNIKTSKIVALVLSIAMILNVFAGLSLTSFAADVTVGMFFMDQNDHYSTPSEFVAGQSYTAVVTLQNYNAANAAAYPISGLQIDVAVDSQIASIGYVGTYETSGYQFDGTKDFARATTDENGKAVVRFASVYGAPADDGSFAYSTLASSEATIEVYAFIFTIAESATGTISFPMTVIATDASLSPYEFVVDSRTIDVTAAAASKTEIGLYGPDLEAINDKGTYNLDSADGYTAFGTSWVAAGFAEGSSLVRMSYNNFVYLGDFDFSDVTKIEITYATDAGFNPNDATNAGEVYSLGLSKVAQSFGWADTQAVPKSNFANAIAYGHLTNGTANGWGEHRVLTITEGIDTTYSGATYLTTYGCNGYIVAATKVVLYRSTGAVETFDKYQVAVDAQWADGVEKSLKSIGGVGAVATVTGTTTVSESIRYGGWLCTKAGMSSYEYSLDGTTWNAITECSISNRGDLIENNIPYSDTGSATAGFDIVIPATGLAEGTNNITVRGIDLAGNKIVFLKSTVVYEPFDVSSYEKVVDVEFSENGIVDNLNGAFGTITGSATSYTEDSVANMYVANFDNSSSDSDAIKTAPIPKAALNIMAVTSTYETYFKMNPSTAEEAVFSSCESAGVGLFSPLNETSKYEFIIRDSAGYTTLTFDGAAVDTWYHMVVVVDNRTATMYVNGVAVDTETLASNIVWTNAGGYTPSTFVIGGDTNPDVGVTEYAKDLSVGVARVYTKALSAAEVLDAYEALVDTTVTYNVSVGTVSNGTVTVAPNGTVEEGTTVTVTAKPAANYVLDKILVNGTAITGTTFTVTADSVVTATFKKVQYTVSVGTVSNGTVTLSKTGSVDYGTTITVTATPATGYELESILVNGTAISGTTFTVTADSVVTATFTEKVVEATEYTITFTVGGRGKGTVSANGTTESRTYGQSATQTFTVKVKAGETVNIATVSQPFVKSSKNYASICTLIESSNVTLTCTNASKTGEYTGATFTMPESDVAITVNIRVFGDINYDGNINVMDINAIKKHIGSSAVLTGEKLIVANAVGNYTGAKATVNVMDLNGVKAFIGKGTLLANGVYA